MNRNTLIALAIAGVFAAWMLRYDVNQVARGAEGQAPAAYVLDRWTGSVDLVFAANRRRVVDAPASPEQPAQ